MAQNIEFYRKQSAQLDNMATKIERNLSTNRADEKKPELLKRKSSLQQNLECQLGGAHMLRQAILQEQSQENEKVLVELESGGTIELSSPKLPQYESVKQLALFREASFQELYALEKPYENRPMVKV